MNENKTNINWYPGHMAKTKRLIKEKLGVIDIVLEIVDSRVPMSSKIADLDDIIKNKKRILVMSKYDLCDEIETSKWIKYYEKKGYIVIPVNLKNNLDYKKIISRIEKETSSLNDKRELSGLMSKEIKVLVIGIPNVGKSTLINAFAGKKSQKVENKPGVTKELVWLKTNYNIRLLDTPGLLWPKLDELTGLNLSAISSIKNEVVNVNDIAVHILNILIKRYPNILLNRYNVKTDDIELIYNTIGNKIGAIKKDEIDYERVSLTIINDVKNENIIGITLDKYNG